MMAVVKIWKNIVSIPLRLQILFIFLKVSFYTYIFLITSFPLGSYAKSVSFYEKSELVLGISYALYACDR